MNSTGRYDSRVVELAYLEVLGAEPAFVAYDLANRLIRFD